ncbi:MAG: DUF4190 domain-containing protein [Oscillospiraceae bacterium]|nr:DUF4190 domain-containing protein [Oscillospiraceae bacterium]
MNCSKCGNENNAGDNYCSSCNNNLNTQPSESTSPSASDAPQTSAAPQVPAAPYSAPSAAPGSQSPQYPASPSRPGPQPGYQQPVYYPSYAPRVKQPFTITDCYIIIGFVLAIVGVFAYAFILLPASIGFSIVGFVKRTNVRTLGLSIAGIVVGVVSSLIKLGTILSELGVIPDWLSAGIFR